MSAWLIGIVTVIYLVTALSLWVNERNGLAICFIGYALANIGLIMDVTR